MNSHNLFLNSHLLNISLTDHIDPKPAEQSIPVEETKSVEDYSSSHPTRDTDDRGPEVPSESPDNDGRKEKNGGNEKQKYSSMSAEVCFTKDRPMLQKRLAKRLDVRYVDIKQKIRSSCMLVSLLYFSELKLRYLYSSAKVMELVCVTVPHTAAVPTSLRRLLPS